MDLIQRIDRWIRNNRLFSITIIVMLVFIASASYLYIDYISHPETKTMFLRFSALCLIGLTALATIIFILTHKLPISKACLKLVIILLSLLFAVSTTYCFMYASLAFSKIPNLVDCITTFFEEWKVVNTLEISNKYFSLNISNKYFSIAIVIYVFILTIIGGYLFAKILINTDTVNEVEVDIDLDVLEERSRYKNSCPFESFISKRCIKKISFGVLYKHLP